MLSNLTGQIENITYANEENGFAVVQVQVPDRPDLITVVGHLIAPTAGEVIEMKGEWFRHPKFGLQFKLVEHRSVIPATPDGIRKYLGSGLIQGLGPKLAERIVKKFGAQTLEILETDIDKLGSVAGIGAKRLALIQKTWHTQKKIHNVMLFLQSHNVSAGQAIKIFQHYGDRSVALVKSDPYRLASDIFGIGFTTADRIATHLGFAPDAPSRIAAGILYILTKQSEEGHVFYPYKMLVAQGRQTLKVSRESLARALEDLVHDRKIVIEEAHNIGSTVSSTDRKAVYLHKFFHCETHISKRLADLTGAQRQRGVPAVDDALAWVQGQLSVELAKQQRLAVKTALTSKVMIVTGGPGTGKTTLISALLKIHALRPTSICLAAPTGRAAKRMSATSGHTAVTIHRLLEYSFKKGGFQRNAARPLACDLLIVDEASMIDTVLMYHLLQALPDRAALVLVGDINQLPSVGAGSILRDMLASGTVPQVRLTQIFRQARASRIITNAHRINSGYMPELAESDPRARQDFFFIEQEDPQKVLAIILTLVGERIPKRFGFDPLSAIQVLTPMHKGLIGADNLNQQLQQTLNPGEGGIKRGDQTFRVGDKIMQVRNNYDKEIFNGDVGVITNIRSPEQALTVSFDGRSTTYSSVELDEIVLAYAISVHKSQGSEYSAVVIPVLTQHYILLQRNLIYTAVTRGRELVVVVGSRKALAMGIKNNKTRERHTLLKQRLQKTLAPANLDSGR